MDPILCTPLSISMPICSASRSASSCVKAGGLSSARARVLVRAVAFKAARACRLNATIPAFAALLCNNAKSAAMSNRFQMRQGDGDLWDVVDMVTGEIAELVVCCFPASTAEQLWVRSICCLTRSSNRMAAS